MHNKVLGGNYMMRSTTFLMQDASPPQKDLINCELFSSLGESRVQFPSDSNSKKVTRSVKGG